MPYLNVKLSAPESPETTERIASLLTTLTADVLRKKRELTSVALDYVTAQRWYIGGASLATQGTSTFFLDVKITEGTNTKDEKASYVRQVFAAVESVLGTVTQGAIALQIEGKPVQHLKAGDAFYEPAQVPIARFDNDGESAAEFTAFYLVCGGSPELVRILAK